MAGTKIAESGEIASATALIEAFSDHIRQDGFPCVGAKSALQRDGLRVVLAGSLDDSSHDQAIHYDLVEMSARYWNAPTQFHSLAILFPDDPPSSEKRFEHCLWERVNALTAIDMAAGFEPDPRASADPDNAHFSLSFGGEGFFVVGLHPHASRPARRFDIPVLVFNIHEQFELLRTHGTFEKVRDQIRKRDRTLAGSLNPMISDHGEESEACQYSGRAVGEDWKCPYHRADDNSGKG